eukprot:947359-Lingulodinium_polyedra.AAC.1
MLAAPPRTFPRRPGLTMRGRSPGGGARRAQRAHKKEVCRFGPTCARFAPRRSGLPAVLAPAP